MSVLIIVGPKHGSAREIAIAGHLNASGHHATAADAEAPPGDLDQFDASVIGSAIYMAHWTKQARRFIDEHTTQLAARSEWLFSGGLR